MYEKEIDAGMKFLDRNVEDWINKINVDTIEMRSDHDCIIGQLYQDFFIGKLNLNFTYEEGENLGFTACDWDQLTMEWKTTLALKK